VPRCLSASSLASRCADLLSRLRQFPLVVRLQQREQFVDARVEGRARFRRVKAPAQVLE
jgi:hypothetical protein